jgi:hypothetical protein
MLNLIALLVIAQSKMPTLAIQLAVPQVNALLLRKEQLHPLHNGAANI